MNILKKYPSMAGSITLKVKVRKFPSHGRVRVHETVLPMLGAKEEETLIIAQYPTVFDQKTKTVEVTGYSDKMVSKSVVMISPEDMAALGVDEGDTISVIRKVSWMEKITKEAAKTGDIVRKEAVKAGNVVKEGTAKAGESIEKGAKDIAKKVTPKKGSNDL
jgi:formylmethanofuran dehydrogenase subunit D